MTSWVPDYSFDAPDGHTWMRSSTDCPDCKCCSAALCDRARSGLLGCNNVSSGASDFDLSQCPCSVTQVARAAVDAARTAVQAEPDDDAAIEAGARALHTEMTRPMSTPPAWESSPYAADYREMVQRGLSNLRKQR